MTPAVHSLLKNLFVPFVSRSSYHNRTYSNVGAGCEFGLTLEFMRQ